MFLLENGDIVKRGLITGAEEQRIAANIPEQTLVLGTNNNVFSYGSELASHDLSSGLMNWSISSSNRYFSMPSVGSGIVATYDDNFLFVYHEFTGELLWQWAAPQNLLSNIIITIDHIFVSTANTTYALNFRMDQLAWSYPQGGLEIAIGAEGALLIYDRENLGLTAINLTGDTDEDGIPQWWEQLHGGDLVAEDDLDTDGLTNLEEYEARTNPNIADSDDDGLSDGYEVNDSFTDPKTADSDGDGLSDSEEVNVTLTGPNIYDTDEDGVSDGLEVNFYMTDPLDVNSVPEMVLALGISFEQESELGLFDLTSTMGSWFRDQTEPFDGSYALRSADIGNSQQVSFSMTNTFSEGQLAFYARLDTESCCDRLMVYLDNVLQFSTSQQSWEQYFVDIPGGLHTITWTYSKDSSVDRGLDSVWIDQITYLPGL